MSDDLTRLTDEEREAQGRLADAAEKRKAEWKERAWKEKARKEGIARNIELTGRLRVQSALDAAEKERDDLTRLTEEEREWAVDAARVVTCGGAVQGPDRRIVTLARALDEARGELERERRAHGLTRSDLRERLRAAEKREAEAVSEERHARQSETNRADEAVRDCNTETARADAAEKREAEAVAVLRKARGKLRRRPLARVPPNDYASYALGTMDAFLARIDGDG